VARIEVETADIERLIHRKTRAAIVKELRKIGFAHVAVDLEGYRQGSLNRALDI
jgi:uncharacterized protein